MLKLFAATCLSIAMLLGYYPKEYTKKNTTTDATITVATCTGNTPCNACANCSKCKYCSNGGTCGKCVKGQQSFKSKSPAPVDTQCKAVTKKGTRCSRKASDNGYCWQHG